MNVKLVSITKSMIEEKELTTEERNVHDVYVSTTN